MPEPIKDLAAWLAQWSDNDYQEDIEGCLRYKKVGAVGTRDADALVAYEFWTEVPEFDDECEVTGWVVNQRWRVEVQEL